eukprot:1611485-Rhodomonas_salina.1
MASAYSPRPAPLPRLPPLLLASGFFRCYRTFLSHQRYLLTERRRDAASQDNLWQREHTTWGGCVEGKAASRTRPLFFFFRSLSSVTGAEKGCAAPRTKRGTWPARMLQRGKETRRSDGALGGALNSRRALLGAVLPSSTRSDKCFFWCSNTQLGEVRSSFDAFAMLSRSRRVRHRLFAA